MDGLNLYFDDANKKYFYVGVPLCFKCNKQVLELVFISAGYSKQQSYIREYCVSCMQNVKDNHSTVKEIKRAIVIDKAPLSSRLVFIKPPSLSNTSSSASVFEASSPLFDKSRGDNGVKIIDKTIFSSSHANFTELDVNKTSGLIENKKKNNGNN